MKFSLLISISLQFNLVLLPDHFHQFLLVPLPENSEFCGMVRKILILTKEEVQSMNPGTSISKGEENSSVAAEMDAKVVKNLPSSSTDDC